MDLEGLSGVTLIGELLGQGLDNIGESVLKGFVHLGEVSLLVERVLHFLHPSGEFVTEVVELVLEVSALVGELSESSVVSTTSHLWDFEVGKHLLQLLEFLLQGSYTSFKLSEVSLFEVFKLSAEHFMLVTQSLSCFLEGLFQLTLCTVYLLVSV